MRAPSKRVTFVVAFVVANFLLFFPFASEAHQELPDPAEGGGGAPGEESLEEGSAPGPAKEAVPESADRESRPDGLGEEGGR